MIACIPVAFTNTMSSRKIAKCQKCGSVFKRRMYVRLCPSPCFLIALCRYLIDHLKRGCGLKVLGAIVIGDSSSSDADGGQLIVGSPCVSAAAATPPRFGTRPCKPLLAPAVYISTCDPRFSSHRCTNAPLVVTDLTSVAIVLPAVATVLILMIPALLLELERFIRRSIKVACLTISNRYRALST